jgi:hypothetical protein
MTVCLAFLIWINLFGSVWFMSVIFTLFETKVFVNTWL